MNGEPKALLSRVADAVYWLARYMERAENVARFMGVNLHLQLDLPLDPVDQWAALIDTSGDAEVFSERYGEPGPGRTAPAGGRSGQAVSWGLRPSHTISLPAVCGYERPAADLDPGRLRRADPFGLDRIC